MAAGIPVQRRAVTDPPPPILRSQYFINERRREPFTQAPVYMAAVSVSRRDVCVRMRTDDSYTHRKSSHTQPRSGLIRWCAAAGCTAAKLLCAIKRQRRASVNSTSLSAHLSPRIWQYASGSVSDSAPRAARRAFSCVKAASIAVTPLIALNSSRPTCAPTRRCTLAA